MRLEFSGTPEQVLKEMREWVARLALEFGEEVVHNLNAPPARVEQLAAQIETAPQPSPPELTRVEVPGAGKLAISAGKIPCIFCGDEFKNAGMLRHQKYCDLNPNAVPHPLAYQKDVAVEAAPVRSADLTLPVGSINTQAQI